MAGKILITALLFSVAVISAQHPTPKKNSGTRSAQPGSDELAKHLSAAETYQVSGDLVNAGSENRAIIGIGLHRAGNVAIEEGKYDQAVDNLNESIKYADNAAVRTNLAVAYLRLNQLDKALSEAKIAVAKDPKFPLARYILGNIHFTKEEYAAALPELEKVLILAPDFDSAHALGLTYLHLKQPERARLLFEEMQTSFGKGIADLHILFGQAYEQTNYPLDAEKEFRRALEKNPRLTRAHFFLGYVILQHGGSERLAEAGKAFQDELKLNPADFYANFFSGVVASAENDHRKAVEFLTKAAKADPKRSETYLFLGQSQLELNELITAENNLRLSIELSKGEAKSDFQLRRTHFLLGRLLIKTGRKTEGEKELFTAREIQDKSIQSARDEISRILGNVVGSNAASQNGNIKKSGSVKISISSERAAELKHIKAYLESTLAQAFHNLGVIAIQNRDVDEAIINFTAASKWKPDFPGVDRNLGIVSFQSRQIEKAIGPLARHLRANPQDNLIRRILGTSYYLTKEFARSVETLKPIESAITDEAELAYFYVISLIQLRRNSEAIVAVNKLATASQKRPASLFYAAQGFMLLGDYERAVKELRLTLALDPNTQRANYFLGQSLIRLNRYEEAEKAFERELEVSPADASAKYHLALTLIERKIQIERAIMILEEAIALSADYPDARYQLGKIYLERGETEKALVQLEAAAFAKTEKDYIHYQLSIAYRKASRKDDADRELRRYQELKAASRKNSPPIGNNENLPQ